jgi:hypothetical protein
VRDPQVSGANCEAEPRQQWRGSPVGSVSWVHFLPDHSPFGIPLAGDLMKQSERTPLWVWLTFGLIGLGIAAYAAVQDGIVAAPDLRTITEAARAIILGGCAPLAAQTNAPPSWTMSALGGSRRAAPKKEVGVWTHRRGVWTRRQSLMAFHSQSVRVRASDECLSRRAIRRRDFTAFVARAASVRPGPAFAVIGLQGVACRILYPSKRCPYKKIDATSSDRVR